MDWGQGGGFINDTSMADEAHQVTTSVSVAGADDKLKNTTAVSVAQVAKLTRPNEGLIVFGKKVYHLNLVAYVYEVIEVSPHKIHILVDDHSGSGPLEVSHISGDTGTPGVDPVYDDPTRGSGDGESRDLQTLKCGDYIRCIGIVKYFQDKATVVAYSLRFVEDPNEITMHITEVIRDAKSAEKVQSNGGVYPSVPLTTDREGGMNNAQPVMAKESNEFGKLTTRDRHLLTFLKSKANSENGIHMDEICKNFTAFKRQDIAESLTLLSNEGLCWQSDAEDVWCVD